MEYRDDFRVIYGKNPGKKDIWPGKEEGNFRKIKGKGPLFCQFFDTIIANPGQQIRGNCSP
jgi:hypothetical protein